MQPLKMMIGGLLVGLGIGFLIASTMVDDELQFEYVTGGKVGTEEA